MRIRPMNDRVIVKRMEQEQKTAGGIINEDLCPECGHLLPQKAGSCQFCGWACSDVKWHALEFDSMDEYLDLDIENIPTVDRDIERLIDSA